MENKGFNFLVGIGGLWLLWKLYTTGWLHRIGFMSLSYMTGEDYSYMNCGVFEICHNGVCTGGQAYSITPLAAFASLVIDAIAIFGSLLIMLATGLWDVAMYLGLYLKDMFVTLNEYLKDYTKKSEKPEDKIEEVEVVEETEPKLEEPSALEVILVTLKDLQENQKEMRKELDKKVTVTEIVKDQEVNNE